MATDRIAWELTADPVPIERAFERASTASINAGKVISDSQRKQQEEIERLAKKLTDLQKIQEQTGAKGKTAQDRISDAIARTTAELNSAANAQRNLSKIFQSEITKETGLINTLNTRLARLTEIRNQSNDPTKIQRINVLLEEQRKRLEALSKVPPPPPRRVDEITKETGLIAGLTTRINRLKTARDQAHDPARIQRINQLIQEQTTRLNTLTGAIKEVGTATVQTEQKTSFLGNQLKGLPGLMAAGFSIGAIIAFTKEVIVATGELQSFQARMEGLLGSSELGNQKLDELRNMANELGLNFSDMTKNYIQFVSAAKAQGRSVEEAELIFKNMSVAIAGSGVSADAANRAMTALQQIMAKGVIMSEELKGQLGEALPQAIGWMSQATGKSTAELMKMMEQGQLTADVLLDFSRVAADAMGDNVQNMAEQLNAKMNRLANSWQKFLTQVGSSGIAEASIEGLTMAVDALSFAWAAATLNLGDYIHEQEKAERLANMSEAEKIITKQVQAQIKSYGDEEVAIAELNAQLETQRDKLHEINRAIEANKRGAIYGGIVSIPSQTELDRMAVVEKVLEQELMYLRKGSLENVTMTGETEKQRKEREAIVKAQEKFNRLLREWMLDSKRIEELNNTPQIPDYAKGMGKTPEQRAEENAKLAVQQLETQRLIDAEFERLDKEAFEKQKKRDKEKEEHDKEQLEKRLEQAQLLGQSAIELTGLLSNAYESQTIDLQRQLDKGLITQESYEARLRQIKRKEFEVDRIAALAKIAINTAVQASAATPLLAPFVIAAGGAQAIVVATRPNPYAKGTKRVEGGEKGKDSVLYDSPTGLSLLMPDEMIMPAKKTIAHAPYLDNVFDGNISPTQSRWAAGLFVNQTIEPGLLRYMASISGGGVSDNRQISQLVKAITKKKSPDFNKPADRIVKAIYQTSTSNSFSSWRKYKK